MANTTERHSLADVDRQAKTAVCSICGPTIVRVQEGRGAQCVVVRNRHRHKRFLSPRDRAALMAAAGNRCAICGSGDGLVVDHDHSCCGRWKWCNECIRGVLCGLCNPALGGFRDQIPLLYRAIAYLSEERPLAAGSRPTHRGGGGE